MHHTRSAADVRPDSPARIHRPQVAKQPFSRLSQEEAAAQDGVDTTVVTRQVEWRESAMSDCPYGCKVYAGSHGKREVQHNGNYNCPRAGERVRV